MTRTGRSPAIVVTDETIARTQRDSGLSLVEIIIAVVLLGSVVVATVQALGVTVEGTRLSRDRAKAHQWLQSATGVLRAVPRVGCDLGEEYVRLQYQDAVRAEVVNPPAWEDSQLTILPPVKVWDGSQYWDPAVAPKPCYDSDGFRLQLITMQVTSPDGDIIETLQVVKDD